MQMCRYQHICTDMHTNANAHTHKPRCTQQYIRNNLDEIKKRQWQCDLGRLRAVSAVMSLTSTTADKAIPLIE